MTTVSAKSATALNAITALQYPVQFFKQLTVPAKNIFNKTLKEYDVLSKNTNVLF
jgi:hypothetical protein